jgi:hypothetical protein
MSCEEWLTCCLTVTFVIVLMNIIIYLLRPRHAIRDSILNIYALLLRCFRRYYCDVTTGNNTKHRLVFRCGNVEKGVVFCYVAHISQQYSSEYVINDMSGYGITGINEVESFSFYYMHKWQHLPEEMACVEVTHTSCGAQNSPYLSKLEVDALPRIQDSSLATFVCTMLH